MKEEFGADKLEKLEDRCWQIGWMDGWADSERPLDWIGGWKKNQKAVLQNFGWQLPLN